jgi:hypothetical protein
LKPFYWLGSAGATEHFTGCGLVETDRLIEKAEKAREGFKENELHHLHQSHVNG